MAVSLPLKTHVSTVILALEHYTTMKTTKRSGLLKHTDSLIIMPLFRNRIGLVKQADH